MAKAPAGMVSWGPGWRAELNAAPTRRLRHEWRAACLEGLDHAQKPVQLRWTRVLRNLTPFLCGPLELLRSSLDSAYRCARWGGLEETEAQIQVERARVAEVLRIHRPLLRVYRAVRLWRSMRTTLPALRELAEMEAEELAWEEVA